MTDPKTTSRRRLKTARSRADKAELAEMTTEHAAKLDRILFGPYEKANDVLHEFKNFHRLLCERFGCVHDELNWRRDQLSIIEHIASQIADLEAIKKMYHELIFAVERKHPMKIETTDSPRSTSWP